MTLLYNWRTILLHAWSIRLIIVAGLLSGLAVALTLIDASLIGVSPIAFAALSGAVNMAAIIARLLQQGDAE